MAVRSYSISRPKSSAVNAPAGSLSSRSVITGKQYSSPQEREAADIQARIIAQEALARGQAPPQPPSGGIYTSSLPGSVRSPQAEALRQQAMQERAAGNQQEAALIEKQAAEELKREAEKHYAEREAALARPVAGGQFIPGAASRADARTVLQTAAERREIKYQQQEGITETIIPAERFQYILGESPAFASKAAAAGPDILIGDHTPQVNAVAERNFSPAIGYTREEKAIVYAEEQIARYETARARLSSYGKINPAQRKLLLEQYKKEYTNKATREERLAIIEAKGGYKNLSTTERLERIKLKAQIAAGTPEIRETLTTELLLAGTGLALIPSIAIPAFSIAGAVDIPFAMKKGIEELSAGIDPLQVLATKAPRIALDIWAVRGTAIGREVTSVPGTIAKNLISKISIVEPKATSAFYSIKFGKPSEGIFTQEKFAWSTKEGRPIIAAKWETPLRPEGIKPSPIKTKASYGPLEPEIISPETRLTTKATMPRPSPKVLAKTPLQRLEDSLPKKFLTQDFFAIKKAGPSTQLFIRGQKKPLFEVLFKQKEPQVTLEQEGLQQTLLLEKPVTKNAESAARLEKVRQERLKKVQQERSIAQETRDAELQRQKTVQEQRARTEQILTQKPKELEATLAQEHRFAALSILGQRPKLGQLQMQRAKQIPALTVQERTLAQQNSMQEAGIKEISIPQQKIITTQKIVTEQKINTEQITGQTSKEILKGPVIPGLRNVMPGFGEKQLLQNKNPFSGQRLYKVITPKTYQHLVYGKKEMPNSFLKRKKF